MSDITTLLTKVRQSDMSLPRVQKINFNTKNERENKGNYITLCKKAEQLYNNDIVYRFGS